MAAKDIINFRGDKRKWKAFAIKLKQQDKEVWDVIGPMIEKYTKKKKR